MTVKEALEKAGRGADGIIEWGINTAKFAKLDNSGILRWVSSTGQLHHPVPCSIITDYLWQPYIEKKACTSCVIYKELIATANYNTQSTMKRLLNVLKKQQCTNEDAEECE